LAILTRTRPFSAAGRKTWTLLVDSRKRNAAKTSSAAVIVSDAAAAATGRPRDDDVIARRDVTGRHDDDDDDVARVAVRDVIVAGSQSRVDAATGCSGQRADPRRLRAVVWSRVLTRPPTHGTINNTTNLLFKTAIGILLISNHNSFQVPFDKIASVYYI